MIYPKLYVVGGSIDYADYLMPKPGRSVQFELTKNPEKADFAMFTGGSDISPHLYKQRCAPYTHVWMERDMEEVDLFEFFKDNEIPMIGICRGHQFLAAMAGGALIQDVDNHATGRTHNVIFEHDGKEHILPMTSLHHQMVDPTKLGKNWKVIGRSEDLLSTHYWGENKDHNIHPVDTEIEALYFTNINSIGIQGHPEMMNEESPSVEMWRQLIKEHIL